MVERPNGSPSWRDRLLGERDSWRRVVLAGIGGGLAFAIIGAFAVAFISDGGGGALDKSEPTAIAPGAGPDVPVDQTPIEVPTEPLEQPPTDVPEEVPTEPVEVPTEEPTFEPAPTEPVVVPTEPATGFSQPAPSP